MNGNDKSRSTSQLILGKSRDPQEMLKYLREATTFVFNSQLLLSVLPLSFVLCQKKLLAVVLLSFIL